MTVMDEVYSNLAVSLNDINTTLSSFEDVFALTLLQSNILTNPATNPQQATTVSHTYTSQQSPQVVYGPNAIGGNYGALLASVSLSVDAVFQTNYQWQFQVTGVTGPTTPFQDFDPTVNVFDIVPSGKFFYMKPGANIQINAYNATSGNTTDGIMSVYVVWNILTPQQYQIINKYAAGAQSL